MGTTMSQTAASLSLPSKAVGLRVADVTLAYDSTPVLKNVSVAIEPGEFFAFLGPSGSGKTTLLRFIAGFAQADTGSVFVGSKDITGLPPWKRDVGMVFQSYALWPHMTVRRNVAFGLEERKVPRADINERVAKALELVGLGPLADRRPWQLSGGQQQRVALARTIVVQPKVLLLDDFRAPVMVDRCRKLLQTRGRMHASSAETTGRPSWPAGTTYARIEPRSGRLRGRRRRRQTKGVFR